MEFAPPPFTHRVPASCSCSKWNSERPLASPSPSLSVCLLFVVRLLVQDLSGWAGGRDKDFGVGLENWQPMLRSDFTALSLHVLWKVLFQPSPAMRVPALGRLLMLQPPFEWQLDFLAHLRAQWKILSLAMVGYFHSTGPVALGTNTRCTSHSGQVGKESSVHCGPMGEGCVCVCVCVGCGGWGGGMKLAVKTCPPNTSLSKNTINGKKRCLMGYFKLVDHEGMSHPL